MMAYVLLNYDIKYMHSKPRQTWIGEMPVPDMKATISVRRKLGTVKA